MNYEKRLALPSLHKRSGSTGEEEKSDFNAVWEIESEGVNKDGRLFNDCRGSGAVCCGSLKVSRRPGLRSVRGVRVPTSWRRLAPCEASFTATKRCRWVFLGQGCG